MHACDLVFLFVLSNLQFSIFFSEFHSLKQHQNLTPFSSISPKQKPFTICIPTFDPKSGNPNFQNLQPQGSVSVGDRSWSFNRAEIRVSLSLSFGDRQIDLGLSIQNAMVSS